MLSSNLGKTVCKDLAKQLYTFVSHNNLDLKVVSFKKAPDGSVIIPDEESHYSLLPKFSPLLSQKFGAHHFDCFATTANVRGSPRMKFCSRLPETEAAGINVFSFPLAGLNCYANPPFALMGPFLLYLKEQKAKASVIAPQWDGFLPDGFWWTAYNKWCKQKLRIARPGETCFQQIKNGEWIDAGPLPWAVWIFRFDFS